MSGDMGTVSVLCALWYHLLVGWLKVGSGFGRPEVQPGAPRRLLASGLVSGRGAPPPGDASLSWDMALTRPRKPHWARGAGRGACSQAGRGTGAPGPSLMVTRDLTFPTPGGRGGPRRKPPGRAQPVRPVGPGGTRAPGRCSVLPPPRHLGPQMERCPGCV